MGYNIAVYVDDYLLLLEFQEMFDKLFHKERVSVYATEKLEAGIGSDLDDIFNTDLEKLNDYDIVILLHEINPKILDGFNGTIIDITATEFDKKHEVKRVYEPILSIVENLDIGIDKLDIGIHLPAVVYGKDGIEDFMRQSRDVFTFESKDNIILEDRLAFNAHFKLEKFLIDIPISKSISILKEKGAEVLTDMLPLSTVFILDVTADKPFELLNADNYSEPSEMFMASDVAESSEIFVLKRRYGFRFIADYNKQLISAISVKLKEVIS